MNPDKYLVVVTFTGGNRLLTKNFFTNEILGRYQYKRRVMMIFPTALIHSIKYYEINLIREQIIKPIPSYEFKIIREDL